MQTKFEEPRGFPKLEACATDAERPLLAVRRRLNSNRYRFNFGLLRIWMEAYHKKKIHS
jgi:hypothetical protein